MSKPGPDKLREEILKCEAGSREQIALVIKEVHLKIGQYLKHGYWPYVEEAVRCAITKVQGRWPGQHKREIPQTHLRLGREITGESLRVRDLIELASAYPDAKLFVYVSVTGTSWRKCEPVRFATLIEPSNSDVELRLDHVEKP